MSGRINVTLDVSAIPAKPVGAGRYVVELARALSARDDNHTELLTRAEDIARWRAIPGSSSAISAAPASRPARLLWEQVGLPGVIRKANPDVHHGPHYTLPRLAKVPKVVTVHDMTFFDNPEWHERAKVRFFRHAIASSVKQADAIIAVSQDTADRLQSRFGALPVSAIPHGVDHARFRPTGSDDEAAAELQLLADHDITGPFIAFVGTLEPRKDVPSIIAAFNEVANEYGDLSLVLAGRDGWGMLAIEAAIESSPFRERIIRPGYLPDAAIPALLRHARVVAYPSLVEGFGLPALEALACGAVLVTTTGSAMDEVVDDGALLVAPSDVSALTAALQTALTDTAVAVRLRARGPEVAAKFTWEASAAAHLDVYRSVAARR